MLCNKLQLNVLLPPRVRENVNKKKPLSMAKQGCWSCDVCCIYTKVIIAHNKKRVDFRNQTILTFCLLMLMHVFVQPLYTHKGHRVYVTRFCCAGDIFTLRPFIRRRRRCTTVKHKNENENVFFLWNFKLVDLWPFIVFGGAH